MVLFDTFKQFLQLTVSNSLVVGQNVVLSNASYAQSVANHISALTSDRNLRLNTTNVSSASGLLVSDANRREIRFKPLGSDKVVQGFLEANISTVRKIWQRSDDAAGTVTDVPYGTLPDGRRYYVTDSSAGVFYLNEYGQILGAVPGFGITTSGGYGTPVSAITFTISNVEYIAIICTEHLLRIFDTATFTQVGSFGTAGAAGLPGANALDTPLDLAFNSATSTLYVACGGTATPPGSADPGFVASFNLVAPATPTFGQYVALNNGASLHQGQVILPSGLFYDSALGALWILSVDSSNDARPFEIGALAVTGVASNRFLKGYVEFRGSDFALNAANRIHVDVGRRRLYVTNSPGVEVFDLVTMKHLYTFGYYGVDENAANRNAPTFSPQTGLVQAVGSDVVSVDGVLVNCALFNDSTNNRLVRIGENSYEGENVVIFNAMEFTVPVSLHGYLVKGTISSSKIQMEFRTSSTGAWQILSQTDSVPSSTYFQFRLKVNADLRDIIQENAIREVIVIGEVE